MYRESHDRYDGNGDVFDGGNRRLKDKERGQESVIGAAGRKLSNGVAQAA